MAESHGCYFWVIRVGSNIAAVFVCLFFQSRALGEIMQPNHLGFTLIELLVVVRIIGILASVALPQYQKAVEKSRAAEAIQTLKTLRDQQALLLLNGEDSDISWGQGEENNNLFTNIDVEIKGTKTPMCDYGTTAGPATKNFEYWADGQYILAIRRPCNKYTLETTAYQSNYKDNSVNNIVCYNDTNEKDWCKMFGGEGVPIH